jgi:hypothetical protein
VWGFVTVRARGLGAGHKEEKERSTELAGAAEGDAARVR